MPVFGSASPDSVLVGSGGFTLSVGGSGFVPATVVRWNGQPRPTTYGSPTALSAAIPAADVATATIARLSLFTPPPGGGVSASLQLTVRNPLPEITGFSPTSATAGGDGFALTISGRGFVAQSSVTWNGAARATQFVSATQLSAAIPATDLADAGAVQIVVFNPGPGGGSSAAASFVLSDGVPNVDALVPSSAMAGGDAFTLTVAGSGFVRGSVVRWGGADRPTAYVSRTRLSAQIPASDIAAPGEVAVTVFNPAPAGGLSAAQTFEIGAVLRSLVQGISVRNRVPPATAIRNVSIRNQVIPGVSQRAAIRNDVPPGAVLRKVEAREFSTRSP